MPRVAYSKRFVLLRFFLDCLLIPCILVLAYIIKFKIGWIFIKVLHVPFGEIYDHAQVEPYLAGSIYMILTWVVVFYLSGVYTVRAGIMHEVDEWVALVKGITIATVMMGTLTFVYPVIPDSRFVIFYSWVVGIVVLTLQRAVLIKLERKLLKKGLGAQKTLVMGTNELGVDIVEKIFAHPFLRRYYVGSLGDEMPQALPFSIRHKFKYLDTLEQYETVLRSTQATVIYATANLAQKPFFKDLILYCEQENIEFNMLTDLSSFMSGTLKVIDFDGMPFISHGTLPTLTVQRVFKRLFDIVVSAIGLVVLSPLFLALAILIKVSSPSGPVFFMQERVGKNGKPFKMIKFRTMIPDAEKHGPQMVNTQKETRYIPFGEKLRRYSLDELPQLINVFKGEMSIIGPRPERQFFVDQFVKTIPYFELRQLVKGGITGWAQINGRSVLTSQPERKVKYDLYYIKNWSLVLDIKIFLKTFLVVFKGEEAY